MPTTSSVFPEGRHGVLKIKECVDHTYYKFVSGVDQDGELRQLVTRGPGKEKAATRIPIRLPAYVVDKVLRYAQDSGINLDRHAWHAFMRWWSATPDQRSHALAGMTVPLVMMPRGGNLVSGLEWNAPGGTARLAESFEAIAEREFDEEAAVKVIGVESPFPPCMFASGIYDEVQSVSFALIVGNPTTLVEGAKGWHEVPLGSFRSWAKDQNQVDLPKRWQAQHYVPVDGKVIFALWWLLGTIGLSD